MLFGTIDALRRYPIKSLSGETLDSAEIGEGGIPGDRADALFVRSGSARVGKTYRGKEHDRLHLVASAGAARAAAADRGVDVELRSGGSFFDDAPVSLIVDRWLESLNAHVGYGVEWERFRPNLFVRAADGFDEEEGALVGDELDFGSVTLRVRCPIERCVAVTYHPRGAASDPRILRFLAQQRNASLGIYCDVVRPGKTRLGDEITRRRTNGASAHTR
ncbi:MAG: MOSC domain-containing protein [Candidatus Eremiobacteraeota bacterium]|nr:MOSC domain-containing protein [Candidatus Eremiobacteraeota bacterium]